MLYVPKDSNKTINTDSCGELTEVLVEQKQPISITVADDIKPTSAHYHKTLSEIYWMLSGTIEVTVNSSGNKQQVITLNTGDTLVIEPQEVHQITKASDKNKLVVLNSPSWRPGDEVIV